MKSVKAFLIAISSLVLVVNLLQGQDIITLKNGDEVKAKIEEVTESSVKYRKFDNSTGPLFTISKSEIFMIRYQNGDKEVIKTENLGSQPRPLPKSTTNLNLLGLLQFGPIIQKEYKLGESGLYLFPHLRIGYFGLLSHFVWTEFEGDSQMDPINFGIGAGIRRLNFAGSRGNVWYGGGLLELSRGGSTYDMGSIYESQERGIHFNIVPNFGYRWRYPTGRFLNLGIYLGYAFKVSYQTRPTANSYYSKQWIDASNQGFSRPISFLELSFGWEKSMK